MDKYLRILNTKFTGDFSSEPYDFGFELDSFQKHAIPWEKAFDNFLAGLELGISKIPQIHVFQTLQEHTRWPTSLQKSMAEFCESTRGNLSVFP